MLKILSVVGARPNFMKVAPLHRAFLASGSIESRIVHTGQHYDARMSDIFFEQLELPEPHHYLGVGGGNHAYQQAHVMLKFDAVLDEEQPDLVLVVGDVNATLATTLVAVKKNIPVAHVEAGLRSGDREMPEEVNRVVTDSICQYHFVSEPSGLVHLARENTRSRGIHWVGNVMIDSLVRYRDRAARGKVLDQLDLAPRGYALATLHRPRNVDNETGLREMVKFMEKMANRLPVVFPLHPRTVDRLRRYELYDRLTNVSDLMLLPPQGYLEFLQLMDNARLVVTDSGGIQEETSFLGVPCLTFRPNTERPVTVTLGTNQLIDDLSGNSLLEAVDERLTRPWPTPEPIPFWDGKTAGRITDILLSEAAHLEHPFRPRRARQQ